MGSMRVFSTETRRGGLGRDEGRRDAFMARTKPIGVRRYVLAEFPLITQRGCRACFGNGRGDAPHRKAELGADLPRCGPRPLQSSLVPVSCS